VSSPTSRTNWAGNIEFAAARYHEPRSVEALQAIVAGSDRVRALGTGHSFNRVADTEGDLVSVRQLPPVLEIDTAVRQVRVSAGMRYGELFDALQSAGLALPNTGSLPHISVAGACATGTHGSGLGNAVLGRSVRAMSMVQADGALVQVEREGVGDDFDGYVLSLGRLGIVTELVLDVVPTFDVAQTVVVDVPDDGLAEHLVEILGAAYSVSVFTALVPGHNRVWLKQRVGDPTRLDDLARLGPETLWGGRIAEVAQHPIDGIDAGFATEQLGRPGPWHERLPHFRLEFQPSAGEELQSEYLLPLSDGPAAWRALVELRAAIREPLLTIEIRSVAADSMWLSATGGQESIAFHFTWERDLARVQPVLERIEQALSPFGFRPHWGKVFTTPDSDFGPLYPRLPDFRRLVAAHDPGGKLGNDLVDGWLGL
jgi:xylitol oxidase